MKLVYIFLSIVLFQLLVSTSLAPLFSSKRTLFVSSEEVEKEIKFLDEASGIRDLDSLNFFKEGLLTHKPVFVFFYSSVCVKCDELKEVLVKFSSEVRGLVRIVAFDGDVFPKISKKFDVYSFPTLMVWGAGEKMYPAPKPYQGEWTVDALRKFFVSSVFRGPSRLTKAKTADDIVESTKSSPYSAVGVFFSSRMSPSMTMTIMSLSQQLVGLPLIFMNKIHSEKVAETFNITSLPTTAVLHFDEDTNETRVEQYSEPKFSYEGISLFFNNSLKAIVKNFTKPDMCRQLYDSSIEDL